jgi:hypothetical protein
VLVLKKALKPSALAVLYLGLLLAALLAGCTSRETPSEVLITCGNHSCGDLMMVTTDTSSDGFQYLEPELSPDGTTILFTADFMALPPDRPPDTPPPNRILVMMPLAAGTDPRTDLRESGAVRVQIGPGRIYYQGELQNYWPDDVLNQTYVDRGSPGWVDMQTIYCWFQTPRGNRLFLIHLDAGDAFGRAWEEIYAEPDDSLISGGFWEHNDPALSPDGQWMAFTRFGATDAGDLSTYTQQALWVISMADLAVRPTPYAFPLTSDVAQIGAPTWSPDGGTIVFHASLDMDGQIGATGTELFTIDFDTTGLAANGGVQLDRNLHRLTHTEIDPGSPINGIENRGPVYNADGSRIVFVSNRRAPSITLHDRNIWWIPSDGRLEPEILYFTRDDDVDPAIPPGTGMLLFSSSLGFPTEMLDRLEEQAYYRILQENPNITPPEATVLAADERRQLEYFERVMSHIYVFTGW